MPLFELDLDRQIDELVEHVRNTRPVQVRVGRESVQVKYDGGSKADAPKPGKVKPGESDAEKANREAADADALAAYGGDEDQHYRSTAKTARVDVQAADTKFVVEIDL